MEQVFELNFSNGHQAKTVRIQRSTDLPAILHWLGLSVARPTLVLVGGASGMGKAALEQVRALFQEVLVPVAEATSAAVVDGGTDAGVMQLVGEARSQAPATFPLVGVAATGTVILPQAIFPDLPPSAEGAPLEPNHTHFVLVPGAIWGDESPWIARVASAIAGPLPSFTLLVNGGKIAWQDVSNSVRSHRPVLVVAGSGRTADELAAAIRGDRSNDRAVRLVNTGLLHLVELHQSIEHLTQQMTCILTTRPTAHTLTSEEQKLVF